MKRIFTYHKRKFYLILLIVTISNILTSKQNININKNDNTTKMINIAILGASFSGCSVSYFLNKYFQKYNDILKLNITIIDEKAHLNDNFPHKNIFKTNVDLSNSFIYEWQTNLKKLINDFSIDLTKYNQSMSIGIYDGEEFLINESNKNFINKLKELYPDDMNKILSLLNKFHKSLQVSLNNDDDFLIKNLNDFMNIYKNNFDELNSLFFERIDLYLNNLEINFSFIDKIIRSFLYSNKLQGADNNTFSSLISILSYLSNKYYLKNGLVDLAIKLVYDNPYYNLNTFIKYNIIVKKIEEREVNENTPNMKNNKKYTIKTYNKKTDKIEIMDFFDIIIIGDISYYNKNIDIIDSDLTTDKRKNLLDLSKNIRSIFNHILIGNVDKNYFSIKKTDNILQHEEIEKMKETNENLKSKKNTKNYSFPDFILVNDNQNFKQFSQIHPVCKNCYLNRFYDENKQKFNTIFKIVSIKEILNNAMLKKLFNGRIFYEEEKGFEIKYFDRKGLIINNKNDSYIVVYPDVEICKKKIYNNFALNFIDDNLEFSLLSSKNIANMILKNYVNEESEILSSDF